MRRSKTLSRIRNGEVIRACVFGHYIPAYLFHAAKAGYDCAWLDLEHRALSMREVENLLMASHHFDIDVLLRPPTLEKTGLYRFLEDGAAGLLIPHVSTAEKAQRLVQAVKFPPLGDRGLDNAGLDADYYIHDADEHVAWANRETFLCVQIETPEAIENVESIAAVDGVDMLFVGPGDLGLRLRQNGGMSIDEAWERVAEACRKHNKPFGGPTMQLEDMQKRKDQGAQMLVNSSEFAAFTSALAADINRYDDLK